EGADAGALREALRILRDDRALLIFPEGTRGDEGTIRPFKAGAGMLGVLSEAQGVPVVVRGSGGVWPRGAALPRSGKITVTFGEPSRVTRRADVDRKEQYEDASRAMMQALARLMEPSSTVPTEAAARPTGPELEAVGGTGTEARPPKFT